MKKLYILLLGLVAVFSACEKEGDKVVYQEPPVLPSIVTMPDLALSRDKGTDTLTFVCTPVDPGFTASATYFLEACPAGDGFQNATQIYSGVQVDEIKITVSGLNQILLKSFPEDATSSVDFRIRCVLVVDGGTGAPGTGDDPFEYASLTSTYDVTLYGLLRLDLIDSGIDQKIVSPLGDGKYVGFVKLELAQAFTLLDPETSTSYGGVGGVLSVDGAAIVPPGDDWYKLNVDINGLTYTIDQNSWGLIGSAVPPYDWSKDINMEYILATDSWSITQDLKAGEFKFRFNDGWAFNFGQTLAKNENLEHDGSNIPVTEDGNYTLTLVVTSYDNRTGTFTITKN